MISAAATPRHRFGALGRPLSRGGEELVDALGVRRRGTRGRRVRRDRAARPSPARARHRSRAAARGGDRRVAPSRCAEDRRRRAARPPAARLVDQRREVHVATTVGSRPTRRSAARARRRADRPRACRRTSRPTPCRASPRRSCGRHGRAEAPEEPVGDAGSASRAPTSCRRRARPTRRRSGPRASRMPLGDEIERLVPRRGAELARALRPGAHERSEHPLGRVDAARVVLHLLADEAVGERVPGRGVDVDEPAVVDRHRQASRCRGSRAGTTSCGPRLGTTAIPESTGRLPEQAELLRRRRAPRRARATDASMRPREKASISRPGTIDHAPSVGRDREPRDQALGDAVGAVGAHGHAHPVAGRRSRASSRARGRSRRSRPTPPTTRRAPR